MAEVTTQTRWASLDRHGELHLADRGVRKADWVYEMQKWDKNNPEDGPHYVVRVVISITDDRGD